MEKYIKGNVTANFLNLRSEPNTSASVICIIPKDKEVEIVMDKSNESWYYIIVNCVCGYVMKNFIQIKKDSVKKESVKKESDNEKVVAEQE